MSWSNDGGIMIELLLALICSTGMCHTETITVTTEAAAIATCESGDTVALGSVDWNAVNVNVDGTTDGGAFQFNDYWIWNPADRWMMRSIARSMGLTSDQVFAWWPKAQYAPPDVQYHAFEVVWNDGWGWRHWSASRSCWEQWLTVDASGRAVVR
jgi:hypothetical protein